MDDPSEDRVQINNRLIGNREDTHGVISMEHVLDNRVIKISCTIPTFKAQHHILLFNYMVGVVLHVIEDGCWNSFEFYS